LAEGERLDALCRLRDLDELATAVGAETEPGAARSLQRHTVQQLVREVSGLLRTVQGMGRELLAWLLVRFQLENLKALLRASVTRVGEAGWREHLVNLPDPWRWDDEALAGAGSLSLFASLLPHGLFRESLEQWLKQEAGPPRLFFIEAALDRSYLGEFLIRVGRLRGDGHDAVRALVQQEADLFHLLLVLRGKFQHGLDARELLRLHVAGTRIPRARFTAMLGEADCGAAVRWAVGRVLDPLPSERRAADAEAPFETGRIEGLAWNRFRRLANRAFRQGPVGPGAVFGYLALRRVETANLITLSEGIRAGTDAEVLRARMIPAGGGEVAHV
jgi:vacuolar-type H+-ATPase subunit C/Vma6